MLRPSSWFLKVHAPFWSEAFLYIGRAIDLARVSYALHQFVLAAARVCFRRGPPFAAGDRVVGTICFGSQNPPTPLMLARHCSMVTKPQFVPPPALSTAHHL